MLLYSRTLLFIHSILNVIVCIYQPQTSSPSLSFPSPHWQPQVVLNVKNLQMRGEDWPLRSKWKSNTPKTHCMYKQRHLKETEALPNVQDSEVKVYTPHSLTGRDSAPFSSVYSLRPKPHLLWHECIGQANLTPGNIPLWSPGLPARSPYLQGSDTALSCLCDRDFPVIWVRWFLLCYWASSSFSTERN